MLKQFEDLSRTVRNLNSVTELIKSIGENTDSVFDVEDNFRGSKQMKLCVDRVKAIPEAGAMMESRYMGPEIDNCMNFGSLKRHKVNSLVQRG